MIERAVGEVGRRCGGGGGRRLVMLRYQVDSSQTRRSDGGFRDDSFFLNPSAGTKSNSIRMPARTNETGASQGKGPSFLLGVIDLGAGHGSYTSWDVTLAHSPSLFRTLSASRRPY